VDSKTHLIDDFQTTNQVTDYGLIHSTATHIRGSEILEATTDKGYHDEKDMVKCLESGIIPHVTLPYGQDAYELEAPYEASECDEETINSSDSEKLKKCLHAGVVPKVYEGVIDKIEVIERKRLVRDEEGGNQSPHGTPEEMLARAKEGFFVRDPERNIVYCPAGSTLRQKSVKKNGDIRYANKLACKNCKCRDACIKGKSDWKEIDFNKDTLEKPNQNGQKVNDCIAEPISGKRKRHFEKVKIVKITFRPDRKKTGERKCISEHPFGTIKRTMNAGYFLLRGKRKVDGEVALMCLGYNIIVAKNLLGFEKMMNAMAV
jgi:transposase